MLKHAVVGLLATLPYLVHADTPEAAAPMAAAASPPLRIREVSLRPTDAGYPPELSAKGVQGTTELRVRLGADGSPTEVSLHASSRSPELDEAAVAVAKGLKFTVKDPSKLAGEWILPVEFLRDSVATLSRKTCAEFNVDVAYFQATFPELETRKMAVVNMTVGAFAAVGLTGLSKERSLASIKRLEAGAKGIVQACAKDPESGYTTIFTRLVKDAEG